MKPTNFFLFIIALFLISTITFAQEEQENNSEPEEVHSGHEMHYNHFAVFAGSTYSLDAKKGFTTIGADYVRMFNSYVGLGVFGEAILADETEWILGGAFYVPIYQGLSFRVGAGAEFTKEVEPIEGGGVVIPELKTKTETLYRAGLLYTFHVGGLAITPSVDFDYVKENKFLVYGLNFGAGF